MRPLVMDFAQDSNAIKQRFEYMYGKAFLVAPVTAPNVTEWPVYLPKDHSWYDFWNGNHYDGGQVITTGAPLNRIPVFVKGGSIIPLGPKVQYASEKKWDNLEIRVYAGASGSFALYEDEDDNYNYEKGVNSTITFNWDDEKKILTIDDRKGSFPGMLNSRIFNLVLVSKGKGIGENIGKVVSYTGKKMAVRL